MTTTAMSAQAVAVTASAEVYMNPLMVTTKINTARIGMVTKRRDIRCDRTLSEHLQDSELERSGQHRGQQRPRQNVHNVVHHYFVRSAPGGGTVIGSSVAPGPRAAFGPCLVGPPTGTPGSSR